MQSKPIRYRKARLVIPKPDSVDKRWVIKYYAEDSNGNYKLFRENDFNHLQLEERKDYAMHRIEEINDSLKKGSMVTAEPPLVQNKIFSIDDAFNIALKNKVGLRPHTIANYTNYKKNFITYIDSIGALGMPIKSLTREIVLAFQRWLISEKNPSVNNRTANNHIEHLKTLLNGLMKEKLIKTNPFIGIENLPEEVGRNIAYNHDQVQAILKYIENNNPKYKLMCLFMYYTLMRSNEIVNCKIGDIGKFAPDQIYVTPQISKNGEARNVTISQPLKRLLQEFKIYDYPKDWYLISKTLLPGPDLYLAKDAAARYRENILNKLDFSLEYTWYSWKHTGTVYLYRAGISKYAIQMQIGHKASESIDKYLKSLGLFENTEIKNHFPELKLLAPEEV